MKPDQGGTMELNKNRAVDIESSSHSQKDGTRSDSEVTSGLIKLMSRLREIFDSITKIADRAQSLSLAFDDSLETKDKNLILLLDLLDDVKAMSLKVKQITSEMQEYREQQIEDNSLDSVAQAEKEVDKVLDLLAKLRTQLQRKVINFHHESGISSNKTEKKQGENSNEAPKTCCHSNSCVDEDSVSLHSEFQQTQLHFIYTYIQTLIRNINTIVTNIDDIDLNIDGSREEDDLHDKITYIRVLERQLARNGPLVQEIEFWIRYDISKSTLSRNEKISKNIDEQYKVLCERMTVAETKIKTKHDLLQNRVEMAKNNPVQKLKSSEQESDEDSIKKIQEYKKYRMKERNELMSEVKNARGKISKLKGILLQVNRTLISNRYISITNDSLVAQQAGLFKMEVDIMEMYKQDLRYLLRFTNASYLSNEEMPEDVIMGVVDLQSKWYEAESKLQDCLFNISKMRELWLLFEYYVMRIIMWNKAVKVENGSQDNQHNKRLKDDIKKIRKKISRVRKIKERFNSHISENSKSIINKMWEDTETEFRNLTTLVG